MIGVPTVTRSNQALAMVLAYLAFSAIYLGTSALAPGAPTTLAPGPLDAGLPFLDWSVWVYLTQFVLLPIAIVAARDDIDRSHALYGMLLATALAALVFLAWPTQVVRETPTGGGLTALAWRMLHNIDVPVNCFPSLHVALAAIAGRALWRRGARAVAVLWPALIAISTLTTRQHVAWDVAGGLVLAAIAIGLTPKVLRVERTQLAHDAAGA